MEPGYRIIDGRTGRPATVVHFGIRRIAELTVLEWRDRQRRGGRPDVSFESVQACRVIPDAACNPWGS